MAEGKKQEPEPPVVRASARYMRVAPRKARLVADQVRGLRVPEARTLLDFSARGPARDIGQADRVRRGQRGEQSRAGGR